MEACKSHFFHLKQCHSEQNIQTLRYIGYKNYYLPDPIRFYRVKAQNSWIHTNVSCCLLLWPLGGACVGFPPANPSTLTRSNRLEMCFIFILLSLFQRTERACVCARSERSHNQHSVQFCVVIPPELSVCVEFKSVWIWSTNCFALTLATIVAGRTGGSRMPCRTQLLITRMPTAL